MSWWQRLFESLRLEQELDKELQFHVDQQVADNLRAGMTEQAARRTTRLAFGGDLSALRSGNQRHTD